MNGLAEKENRFTLKLMTNSVIAISGMTGVRFPKI
jgi:hypothetical protein